jgi:futalosine hydrolase
MGNTFTIKEEALGDLGVQEGQQFRTIFDLHLMDSNESPFSNGLLVNPHKELLDLTGLPAVRGITINEISTDKTRIDWYQQNMAPVVESMEGAALHFTCLKEGIPFLQIRSVSNDIGQRDKSKWDIRSAITNLNQQLMQTIKKL